MNALPIFPWSRDLYISFTPFHNSESFFPFYLINKVTRFEEYLFLMAKIPFGTSCPGKLHLVTKSKINQGDSELPLQGVQFPTLVQELRSCMPCESESEVAQSCLTLSDPMDCSPPGSSIHGIFQARVLEWGAIASMPC